VKHGDRTRILEGWVEMLQTRGSRPRSAQALQNWGREMLESVERTLRGGKSAVRTFVKSDLQRGSWGSSADRLEVLLAFRSTLLGVLSDLTAEEASALSAEFDGAVLDIAAWYDAIGRLREREVLTPGQTADSSGTAPLYDWSTDLFTDAYFRVALPIEVRRSVRYGRPLSLVLVRMDNYEELAAIRSPAGAEAAIREAAGILKDRTRAMDTKCRVATERFTVLLPETNAGAAMVVAERLRESLAAVRQVQEQGPGLVVSAGIAACPEHADDPESLLRRSEEALALADRMGGDVTIVYSQ
jgi:diguanylate cyclase (GGDEF)-like protein